MEQPHRGGIAKKAQPGEREKGRDWNPVSKKS